MITNREAAPAGKALPTRRAQLATLQTWIFLAAILFLGAHFRFLNLYSWDGDAYLHPDERFLIYTVYNLAVPRSIGDYFRSGCAVNGQVPNPSRTVDLAGRPLPPAQYEPSLESGCNTLNPRNYGWSGFFVYGTLPTTLTRAAAELRERVLDPGGNGRIFPEDIRTVGRTLSALFDLGSVLLVFLIGRRLHGARAGLIAALLYALAALPIQLAHFFTVDAASSFFVLLSVYWAVRAAQDGGIGSFTMLGVSIGAAMACRITLATLGLLAILAVAMRLWPSGRRGALSERPGGAAGARARPLPMVGLLVLSGAVTLLTFRVLAPDSFVGTSFIDVRPEPRFLTSITQVSGYVSGKIDAPFSQQWANRTPFLFPLYNMIVWGMGVPFGVAAWVGWAAAGWQILARRRLANLIPFAWIAFYFAWQGGQFGMTMRYYALFYGLLAVLAAWALTALLPRGFSPDEPASAEGGGIAQSPNRPASSLLRLAPPALLTVVLVGTALWAFAFTSIYRAPHTRIAASRWLYENVPPGSTITSEEWDDALPVTIPGQNPSQYIVLKTKPYQEDDPVKYTGYIAADGTYVPGLLDQLDQADYIVLTSNRVYDSATRLPMRYPALTRYYHHLFEGNLGFELAADIHSYPRLFGIEFPDRVAEEAFSVYDHPRVLIFRKTAAYSRGEAERLITGDVAWGEVYKLPTVQIRKMPTGLRLTEAQWPAYRAAGTWSELFNSEGMTNRAPWLFWLLALELLGAACFLLLFRPLRALADRGFALAKALGLLLAAYGAWLLGSARVMAFTPASVWLCAALLILAGLAAAWPARAELWAFLRRRRAALLAGEGLFLAAFFGFLLVRALNPDLWHPARGGEKPMDLAFLTAVLKSAAFPAYDPWYAGGYINYYYFGFVLVGTLVHLTGVVPTTAYNLAVPTLFALTALGAWGVAYSIVAPRLRGASLSPSQLWRRAERRAMLAGVTAAVLVGVAGNLAQAYWLLPGTANRLDPAPAPALPWLPGSYAAQQAGKGRLEWAYWDATRTVAYAVGDGTISEFPFFTFLYGDLHAHMMALPLALAALGLMVALFREATGRWGGARSSQWLRASPTPVMIALLALVVGALRATNTWDFPTYLGMGALTLALAAWLRLRRGAGGARVFGWWALSAIALALLSELLFLPFTRNFATDYAGFTLWFGARTPVAELLKTSGLWLFILGSAGALLYYRAGRLGALPVGLIGVGGLLVAALTLALGMDSLLLLVVLLAGAMMLLADLALREPAGDPDDEENETRARREPSPLSLLLILWGLAAIGLLILPELLVARGDIGRMNSVFKFGMQSWTIFGVTAGVALPWVWRAIAPTRRGAGARLAVAGAWRGVAALLVGAALIYPVTATPARLADRFDRSIGPTLDGTAYMRSATWAENGKSFSLAEDAAALDWMRRTISGTPIVLEAHGEPYRWGGRVAAYTGLPTLLGWPWHETQQRSVAGVGPALLSRQQVIQQIYSGADAAEALRLLQLYGVEYVYVGQLERALYLPAGLAKFDALAQSGSITQVYAEGETRIYQVPAAAHPPAVLTTSLPVDPPEGAPEPPGLGARVGDLPAVNEYGSLGLGGAGEQIAAVALWLVIWYGIGLLGLPASIVALGLSRRRRAGRKARWADGGYAWARLAGLLLLGYAVWLPVSAGLWRYDRIGLLLGALLVLALNAGIIIWLGRATVDRRQATGDLEDGSPPPSALRRPSPFLAGLRELGAQLWRHRGAILQVEALFLVSFLFMLALRALNPDLWHPYWGGEKPFEFGLLNAVLRSPVMPPYSPFFSDGVINYYYYGLFLVSLPVKATGIAPSVAFNLIIPALFGLTVAGVFALAARASGRAGVGLVAVVLVALLGNLAAAFPANWSQGLGPVFAALAGGVGGFGDRLGAWFVGPSRVIPNTINEFPYWGFLFADLHPHLIALPFTVLVIALAYEALLGEAPPHAAPRPPAPTVAGARYGLAALALGALAITNSWDFPTYALVLGGALAGRAWRARRQRLAARVGRLALALAGTAAIAGAGLLLYAPFFAAFRSPVGGLGFVTTTTTLRDYLLIYGLPLAVLVPATFGAARRLLRAEPHARPATAVGVVAGAPGGATLMPLTLTALGLLVVGAVLVAILPPLLTLLSRALQLAPPEGALAAAQTAEALLGTRLWLGALLVVGAAVLLAGRCSPAAWFATWLAVVGWAVSLGAELVFVKDHLAGGDWYRMNTVFKFGMQVWVLLALAAALSLPRLLLGLRRAGAAAEVGGRTLLLALLMLALVFPLAGTPSRTAYRFPVSPGPTLDGLAFMEQATYSVFPQYLGLPADSFAPVEIELRHDAAAIRWLNEHIVGTPVVLQSSAEFYRLYGVRVAANTGLPTVVSPLHEAEQREPALVWERDRDVRALYQTTDVGEALRLLAKYHVGYVYVGPIERLLYGEPGVAKFDALAQPDAFGTVFLEPAYRNEQVTIYRVREEVERSYGDDAGEPLTLTTRPDNLADLERRAAQDPSSASAAWELAQRYTALGRFDDAAAALQRAVAARPEDVLLLHAWGDALGQAGRYDEAEAAYRRAAEAEPTAANYTKLGAELVMWGRQSEAEEALAQANALDPSLPEPYYYLARLSEEWGQRERAAQLYERYLELAGPDALLRESARAALERLGR